MTVYYVLHPLGPHGTGDVLSFSPEQIGAGVDISHLTSIGAIRVATPLLVPPLAPTLATAATGGTVAAGDYLVKISYVTAVGETTPSPSATITTSGATSTLTVTSPAPATGATGWYAYVSQVNGSTLTCQQTAPTPIGTDLVLTAHPTSTGPAPLGVNTSGEAARAVAAQIQATHASPGVGVFTTNGVPDDTSYAGIAAYGSLCWNVAVSPPTFYVNTGTIITPNWAAAGYASLPGLTSDSADGIIVAADITAGGNAVITGTLGITGAATLHALSATRGTFTGPGSTNPTLTAKKIAGQTGYLLNLTDENDVLKASVAVDGEFITVDDVLAPTGTIKGATLAFYPSGTGAPATGAHSQGEMHMDTSGALFVCTVSGTPGTWLQATLA